MKPREKQLLRIQRLHLFTDDTETFVAFDKVDAAEVWKEMTGEKERDDSYDEFEQIPDSRIITIGNEPDDFDAAKFLKP